VRGKNKNRRSETKQTREQDSMTGLRLQGSFVRFAVKNRKTLLRQVGRF
jgi:hypothetical protein